MEVQSECVEPPVVSQCDPQPTGRINKAAFKLFGKRRTGSGNGHTSLASVELVRSKTHDGLIGSNNDADAQRQEGLAALESGPVRSLSKSLSFFSFLRRGSFRSNEHRGAGLVRRGGGLKGFFSSMRWRRKEKTNEGDGELESKKEESETSDSDKVKDITLTLQPPLHHQEEYENAESSTCEPDSVFSYTPTDSPLRPTYSKSQSFHFQSHTLPCNTSSGLLAARATPHQSHRMVDRICSLLFNDVTSLKSFDSLQAAVYKRGHVYRNIRGMTGITSRGSPSKTPNAPTRIQPMFSVTPNSTPVSQLPRNRHLNHHSNIQLGVEWVGLHGWREEMASPEGVDDADMQGLWHMLPSTGDDSPALPRSQQPSMTALVPLIPIVSRSTKPPLPHAPTPDDSRLQQNKKTPFSIHRIQNEPQFPNESTVSSSSSSFRSLKGSTSLPRESKIPISACKNPPPHSASQSALSSVLKPESPPPKSQAPPPTRTRIPISKVPVRRTGNQPTKGTAHKK
uniref:APC membrane recruitment protein 2 n=1 Tax=Gouania willdenowi TaxID=441366 RepID=A0A8C5N8U6_GOUWI